MLQISQIEGAKGVLTKSWTISWSGQEVRMHGREKVELFLLAREEGMSVRGAADFAGVSRGAAQNWALGELPRSYTGVPAPRRIRGRTPAGGSAPWPTTGRSTSRRGAGRWRA